MDKLNLLSPTIGGSGGKKGGHTPVVKDDTIRSTQAIQVIDLLSEGPIKGFAVGRSDDMRKSIYFDDTPIMNPDGTENFRLVGVDARYGEPNQRPLEGFAEVKEHISVGVEVKQKMPNGVVRTLTNTNANRVMVNVAIPSLLEQKDNGDVVEYSVSYDISIQSKGSGVFKVVGEYNVVEKVSSLYVREHIFELHGEGPWDIRVRRHSEDQKDTKKQNALHFDSMAAIIDSKLNYANSAIVGIAGRASDYSSVPNRSYLIDGLIISIPSNYDPIARTYTGDWDGTFKQDWTNNPAWILYDLLTNDRYGIGKYVPKDAQDKWALYEIAQYCDEMVEDGFGGYEPRFTLNAYIFNDQDAYNLLQTMSSMFGGMVYWGAGTVRVVQDKPRSVEALFTNANVEDGKFTYKGTSLKARHTVVMVTWYDPEDMYRPRTEYVQDDEAVAKWGVISTQVVSYGTTSRGQAHRYGRRVLYTEQYATETVSFRTGLEGLFLMPGDVFAISDATRSGRRTGGRVEAANQTRIKLDAEVHLEPTNNYSLSFIRPDGVIITKDVPGVGKVTKTDEIRLALSAEEVPTPGTIWILHTSTFSHKAWQVVSISLVDDTTVEINGLAYRQDKYDAIDKGLKLEKLKHSEYNATPKAPYNVNLLVSNMIADDKVVGLKGLLSWTGDAAYYVVKGKYENGTWATVRVDTLPPKLEIDNILPGKCYFNIAPYSALDVPGPSVDYNAEVKPPKAVLPDVQNLVLDGSWIGKEAKFKWDAVPGATNYLVKVEVGGTEKRITRVGDTLCYTYSDVDMKVDGGPFRSFSVSVKAEGQWGSASENWTTITVGNSQAAAPVNLSVTAGIKCGYVSLTAPPEDDIVGLVVWCSTDPQCPATDDNKVYDGPVGMVTITALGDSTVLVAGTKYYVRAALYDSFGRDSLNSSTAIPFTPLVVDIGPNTITETEIKNDSISTPKLRANAVMAHHIAANQITSTHVAADQITGTHIQAGTLTANHFRSGLGGGNLLPNAGLIPSWANSSGKQADGWTTSGFGMVSVSPDASIQPQGTEYMRMDPRTTSGGLMAYSDYFPVTENNWYEIQALAACASGGLGIGLQFFTAYGGTLAASAAKGILTSPVHSGTASKNLKTWHQLFGLVLSPPGAVAARFYADIQGPLTSFASSYFTRPYVGVATSSQQVSPTPWSPPGLGTYISGGMIKTGTIQADKIATSSLSALSANLGSVRSGDISSSVLRGGQFQQSGDWPNSGAGYYLGGSGLKIGNRNTGRWVEITSNGDFSAPGVDIINGKLTINELRVIKSANIARDAISRHFHVKSVNGRSPSVTVTAHEDCSAIIYYGMDPINAANGSFGPGSLPKITLYSSGAVLHTTPWAVSQWQSGGSNHTVDRYSAHCTGALAGAVNRGTYTLSLSHAGFIDVLLVFR